MIQLTEQQSETILVAVMILKDLIDKQKIDLKKINETTRNEITIESVKDVIKTMGNTDLVIKDKSEAIENG